MQQAARRVVARVVPFAANQGVVFFADDTLTDAEFDGSHDFSS